MVFRNSTAVALPPARWPVALRQACQKTCFSLSIPDIDPDRDLLALDGMPPQDSLVLGLASHNRLG